MYGVDLTPDQRVRLLGVLDEHRRYLERLYARMIAVGMPEDDPMRETCRSALLWTRELCVLVAMGLQKGKLRRYKKDVERWGKI